MGGGASVPKHRDKEVSSSTQGSSSCQKQPSSTTNSNKGGQQRGFQIRKRKQKDSSSSGGKPSAFSRSQQGSMGKLEKSMKAAILIQRWYRQYLARMEIRRRYTWNIFQTVEYAGEQDQMKLYNFFNALLTHIPQKPEASPQKLLEEPRDGGLSPSPSGESPSSESVPSSRGRVKLRKRKVFSGSSIELEQIPVESDYKGPHVKLPITLQNLQELIDGFKSKKILHVRYVAMILGAAASALKRRPNFNKPSTALSKQITVCGDLHGKLDDLLVIFYKNGLPSPENPYVFNGDYVDRGKKSIEIFLILLSCFLLSQDAVYLNRGNHEDHIMNLRYGFIREIRQKYKVYAGKILHLVDQVYRCLPLGTIIDGRVLVVHGGISETTDLKLISDIDRYKYLSILRPPVEEDGKICQLSELYTTSTTNGACEWRQVLDILWSDPSTGTGCAPNTFRGGGSYFGSDVTDKILKKHGLQLLIRSHECKPEGYEFLHDNKCLTIFSASNYYEDGSNKGAYIRLIGGPTVPLEPYFVQFNAAAPKLRGLSMRQRVGLVEASAIKELRTRINEQKDSLLGAFKEKDVESKGLISLTEWCQTIEEATKLKLPWRLLRPKMAEIDQSSGMVKYQSTFDVEKNTQEEDVTVVDVLYRNKRNLEAIFRIIDKDNSGFISMEEFSDACHLLSRHLTSPIPQQQMIEMARSMDMNKDGKIDLNEFLETFRIVSSEQNREEDSLEYEEEHEEENEQEVQV